jgi:hypothetical protein
MLGREEPSSASRAEDTRVPSGSMRMAVLVLAEVTCPTTHRGVWISVARLRRWGVQARLAAHWPGIGRPSASNRRT